MPALLVAIPFAQASLAARETFAQELTQRSLASRRSFLLGISANLAIIDEPAPYRAVAGQDPTSEKDAQTKEKGAFDAFRARFESLRRGSCRGSAGDGSRRHTDLHQGRRADFLQVVHRVPSRDDVCADVADVVRRCAAVGALHPAPSHGEDDAALGFRHGARGVPKRSAPDRSGNPDHRLVD